MLLSSGFSDWLASTDVCVALTTYQAGRLFFIGRKGDGGVRAHERIIEQCQGLWTDGQTLWTSGLYMLWRFENVLRKGETTPDGSGPQVCSPRRSRRWPDRHPRHRGRRRRRRAATDLRQYAVWLPGDDQRNRKFSAAVATKISYRPGAGGSLPPERTGDGWRPSRVRQRGKPLGRSRRLAGPAARRRHTDRRGEQRDRGERLFDAAFAAALRWEALAAEFRHRRIRRRRSGLRHVSHRSAFVPVMRGVSPSSAVTPSSDCRGRATARSLPAGARRPPVGKGRCRTLRPADRRHRQRQRWSNGCASSTQSMNSTTWRSCRACGRPRQSDSSPRKSSARSRLRRCDRPGSAGTFLHL